jgi:hypothetical protein
VESVLTALGFSVSVELSRVESGWVRLTASECGPLLIGRAAATGRTELFKKFTATGCNLVQLGATMCDSIWGTDEGAERSGTQVECVLTVVGGWGCHLGGCTRTSVPEQ